MCYFDHVKTFCSLIGDLVTTAHYPQMTLAPDTFSTRPNTLVEQSLQG